MTSRYGVCDGMWLFQFGQLGIAITEHGSVTVNVFCIDTLKASAMKREHAKCLAAASNNS